MRTAKPLNINPTDYPFYVTFDVNKFCLFNAYGALFSTAYTRKDMEEILSTSKIPADQVTIHCVHYWRKG